MNTTMYINYMTRFCNQVLESCKRMGSSGTSTTFQDKLAEKYAENENIPETGDVLSSMVKNMSMEEYKQYIYNKIANLPVHQSNMQDSISVEISDAGFEAMKNDPEYEKWVLDSLRTSLQVYDPWNGVCGGKFVTFYFGAIKEESRSECWRMGYRHGNGKSLSNQEDGFWERRKKRRKLLKEELEEFEDKKAIAKRMAQSRYYAALSAAKAGDGTSLWKVNSEKQISQPFIAYEAAAMMKKIKIKY